VLNESVQISWAYYRNVIKTNEIAMLLIIIIFICGTHLTHKLWCAKVQNCLPV